MSEQPEITFDQAISLVFFQPSCLALIATASATILAGSVRALKHDIDIRRYGANRDEASVTLDHRHAVSFPLFASLSLMVFFFFFQALQLLLLMIITISSGVSLVFVVQPLLEAASKRFPTLCRRMVFYRYRTSLGDLLLAIASASIVITWLLFGSMLLNNVLGISLCIAFISYVRLPNVKICAMLLSALFLYDIFWVFFSQGIFGSNVMTEAATQQADNPAKGIAHALHLSSADNIAQRLDLPVKLMFPPSLLDWSRKDAPVIMLGLGDMAIPGMLLALLLSEDCSRLLQRDEDQVKASNKTRNNNTRSIHTQVLPTIEKYPYTAVALIGYGIGLTMAFVFGTYYQAAQPALLYLVPCMLLPVVVRAKGKKELGALWEGREEDEAEQQNGGEGTVDKV